MKGRSRGETPRMAFGCMAVGIITLVVVGAVFVVFLWDVNLH